jgi:hypothetical protein
MAKLKILSLRESRALLLRPQYNELQKQLDEELENNELIKLQSVIEYDSLLKQLTLMGECTIYSGSPRLMTIKEIKYNKIFNRLVELKATIN